MISSLFLTLIIVPVVYSIFDSLIARYVDENRMGIFGLCAGGGYSINASMTEKRIKAVAVVSVVNIGRAYSETDFLQKLADVGKQRTLEANGAEQLNVSWTFDSPEEVKKAGITDVDAVEVVDYYKTPRGFHPSANNKRLFISDELIIAFDAFHLAEHC